MKKITFNKILVTHDGSRLASFALPYATEMARAFEAEIILLQAVNSVEEELAMLNAPGMYSQVAYTADFAEDIFRRNKKRAKRLLEDIKKRMEEEGVTNVIVSVEEGFAEEVILEVAKKENCDLIIMSSQGLSGFKRAILGSVTDHVVSNATCPVLVVHPKKGGK